MPKCRCAPLTAIVVSTLSELRVLAAESANRVTGVASFILVADIGDQCLRTLHLNFEGGDQRVFRVNDNVSRFPLKFKANRKLHLCALPISVESSTIQLGSVKLTKLLNRCRHLRSNLGDWSDRGSIVALKPYLRACHACCTDVGSLALRATPLSGF